MISLEYISRTANAMNCCKNIGLSLIANERQGESFDVSTYISGVYTIVLQLDGVNVADKHLIIIH